jgi:hypothetical protein
MSRHTKGSLKGGAGRVTSPRRKACRPVPPATKAREGTVKVLAKVNGKGSQAGAAATFTYE